MWQYISKCNWKTYFQMEKLFHFPNTVVHVSSPPKRWQPLREPSFSRQQCSGVQRHARKFLIIPQHHATPPSPPGHITTPQQSALQDHPLPKCWGGGEDWAMGLSEHNSQPLTVTTTMQGIYLLTLYASVFYNLCFSLYQTLDPGWI